MARKIFFWFSGLSLLAIGLIYFIWPPVLYFLFFIIPYIAIGVYDLNTVHNVLRNYPVIGHLRYMFEFIRPEIQQYFITTDLSGRPFNRETRSLIYERAKGAEDTLPFGTQHDIYHLGYELGLHSLAPKVVPKAKTQILVGGPNCLKPYLASRLNISAMSYGALSQRAVEAMNKGAKIGQFAQDTGEGGLTAYHLKHGGDIIWEIGTGYFGCRTKNGQFDAVKFREKACLEAVKMIAIKISQGAKPSHGGVLPAAKVTPEIAEIRGVEIGKDCISPPAHPAFSTPKGLLKFITELRELSGGKPIGFKLCIGIRKEFMGICKAMLATGITPDFITVDGAEGGTGAAPLEFSNSLGTPINEALIFVHNCLVGIGLRENIRLMASGKIATGFDMVTKIALGADMCNIARAMMFAVGCIQALRCNTNTCPTGVTTHDPYRVKALVPKDKCHHVANLHAATLKNFLTITGAMGIDDPDKLLPRHILRRIDNCTVKDYSDIFPYLKAGELLSQTIHPDYALDWELASADAF